MGKGKGSGKNVVAQPGSYKYQTLPFVSVCTPTFNRRPFIEAAIKCFNHQDYPKEKMEWIVVDDGTDPIEDIIASHPNVRYFKYDVKMPLGRKRNIMHEKSKGDIIVYMDDDDYYPPERVSHAVHMLTTHPKALCAGCSEIYIYFKHIKKMKQFGPYGPNHATAGTFAFRRELLKDHRYDDDACLAEEKAFLKNYTVPFVQLNPLKVILVFSHEHNTFDKRKLLDTPNPDFVKDTPRLVSDFIKEKDLKQFYMFELEERLKEYIPGRPEMKPDVVAQTKRMVIEREQMQQKMQMEQQQQMAMQGQQGLQGGGGGGEIMFQEEGKPPVALTTQQVVQIIQQQQQQIQQLQEQIQIMQQQQPIQIPTPPSPSTTSSSSSSTPSSPRLMNAYKELTNRYQDALRENLSLKYKINEQTETIDDLKEELTKCRVGV